MTELADTSAWFASRRHLSVRAGFDESLVDGEIPTCDMVKLELLYSARSAGELVRRRAELDVLPRCPIGPREWQRALDVYEELARQGDLHHRRIKHPDLLVAAAAEAAGLPIVHYDEDFDAICAVTGQSARWLAPRGSL